MNGPYTKISHTGWELMNAENHGRPPGVIFTNGQYWKELRRFMLRNLRDFGFGKSSMEEIIHDEVTKLCQLLEKIGKEPLDLSGTFNVSIVNSLWSIIVGVSFTNYFHGSCSKKLGSFTLGNDDSFL